MPRESEFGSGYATCLRQFTFHRARLAERVAMYREMATKHADLFDAESAAEIWANGASDHLYELRTPRRGVPTVEVREARAVQDRALDIGHGFRPSSKATPEECRSLLDRAEALLDLLATRGHVVATLDECMATDRELGLSPLAGSWSCSEDLRRTA